MTKIISNITLWTWCFPQSILGLTLYLKFKHKNKILDIKEYKNIKVVTIEEKTFGGISLGKFIILDKNVKKELKHEYGHTIQNYILGPLYLFIIGILSYSLFLMNKKKKISNDNYYKYFPENWADLLGKANRK